MSEQTKQHLDDVARDQFVVELRQPQVPVQYITFILFTVQRR